MKVKVVWGGRGEERGGEKRREEEGLGEFDSSVVMLKGAETHHIQERLKQHHFHVVTCKAVMV